MGRAVLFRWVADLRHELPRRQIIKVNLVGTPTGRITTIFRHCHAVDWINAGREGLQHDGALLLHRRLRALIDPLLQNRDLCRGEVHRTRFVVRRRHLHVLCVKRCRHNKAFRAFSWNQSRPSLAAFDHQFRRLHIQICLRRGFVVTRDAVRLQERIDVLVEVEVGSNG